MVTPLSVASRVRPRRSSIRCEYKAIFETAGDAEIGLWFVMTTVERMPWYPRSFYFCEHHKGYHLSHHTKEEWQRYR